MPVLFNKDVYSNIGILKTGSNGFIDLKKEQILCVLANAFLCTFRYGAVRTEDSGLGLTGINFDFLWDDDSLKLKNGGLMKNILSKIDCIFHYFERMSQYPPTSTNWTGIVTFERRTLKKIPTWITFKNIYFQSVQVYFEGTIEDDGPGTSEIDFANKFIGGGVLAKGCVQEEIRFLINPELIASRLVTEMLGDLDSLCMIGTERSFCMTDSHSDDTELDSRGRIMTEIVAIDAIRFSKNAKKSQFKKEIIDRELAKCYSGFLKFPQSCFTNTTKISTGNWGCGAFNGDLELKFVIQFISASAAVRDLEYFTFKTPGLKDKIEDFVSFLKENAVSVGDLYARLIKYPTDCREGLFDFLKGIKYI